MHKTLVKIQDAVEEAIRPIIAKGASMNAAELDVLTKAVCAIETIQRIENDISEEAPRGTSVNDGNSYRRGRNTVTGRFVSRDAVPYVDGATSRRFYDGDHARADGYSGHSIKDRMVAQLESMYDEAHSDHERRILDTWLRRIQSA